MIRFLVLTLLAAAVLFTIAWQQDGVAAVANHNNSLGWSAPATLSASPQGASGPHLATAKNGLLLLAYIHQEATGHDPYYRLSNDNGVNWTNPLRIHTSPTNSLQVHVVFDNNNMAHAVWVEDESQIRYARQDEWPGNTSKVISQSFLPPLDRPRLVASGTNRLDLIWVQNATGNISIHHAYSTTNGQTWTISGPIAAMNPALSPAVVLDNKGTLHAVWTQDNVNAFGEIAYVQGTLTASGVNWTNHIVISDPGLEDTNNPRILVHNGVINVFFTYRVNDNNQYVYRITCNNNCAASRGNWNQVGNPISGSRLGVNTSDPFNVVSAAVSHQGCIYSYFHGTAELEQTNDHEVIRGVNSCTGWAASARDVVTSDTVRSVFPVMASQKQWLYLVYESGAGANRQIVFRRVAIDAKLYLPLVSRG
jgi:hypothetical protein